MNPAKPEPTRTGDGQANNPPARLTAKMLCILDSEWLARPIYRDCRSLLTFSSEAAA